MIDKQLKTEDLEKILRFLESGERNFFHPESGAIFIRNQSPEEYKKSFDEATTSIELVDHDPQIDTQKGQYYDEED